jgi:DNA anti-recombination protein RmuC
MSDNSFMQWQEFRLRQQALAQRENESQRREAMDRERLQQQERQHYERLEADRRRAEEQAATSVEVAKIQQIGRLAEVSRQGEETRSIDNNRFFLEGMQSLTTMGIEKMRAQNETYTGQSKVLGNLAEMTLKNLLEKKQQTDGDIDAFRNALKDAQKF